MYDAQNDPKCQEIGQLLDSYARAVKDWQIGRRQYEADGGNRFNFSRSNGYPFNDECERKLFNKIDGYLLSLSEEDRAVANSHLLGSYKRYFPHPFAKHAIELASHAIMAHPLSDNDKVKFLEDLFAYDKDTKKDVIAEFGDRVLSKLTNYNPNKNLEATNRLYAKSLAYFQDHKRKNDVRINTLYGMFSVFSKNVKRLSPEAVVNYAGVYFTMADRTTKRLNASILEILALKTPESLKKTEFCHEDVLDKGVIKEIFGAYAEHASKQKDVNDNLLKEMVNWARNMFIRHEYTPKEADELIAEIRPVETAGKKSKIKNNKLRDEFARAAEWLDGYHQYLKDNPKGRSGDAYLDALSPTEADRDGVVDYAKDLFGAAYRHLEWDARLEKLHRMLTKNGTMDKELLLDVVDVYAQSLTHKDMEEGTYNESLHRKMLSMLSATVVDYNYSPNELLELKWHIGKGADGHEDFQDMGRVLENVVAQSGEWRYENSKAKKTTTIIHLSKGGKGL